MRYCGGTQERRRYTTQAAAIPDIASASIRIAGQMAGEFHSLRFCSRIAGSSR